MADNPQNDIERLTLAALGMSTPDETARFRDELSNHPRLAAKRTQAERDSRSERLRGTVYPRRKRLLDLLLATVLLAIFSPVILLFAILIRMTDWGPAIITLPAFGKGGKLFPLYRFRCLYMKDHLRRERQGAAIPEAPPVPDDPRITPVGRLLNRLRIGRLPSFYNVLRGEMSLVGPRPQFHALAREVASRHPDFADRTTLAPGIIGLWHVLLIRPITTEVFPQLLAIDLYYTRHASLRLDVAILLAGALLILPLPRPLVIRLCNLPNLATIQHKETVEESDVIAAYSQFAGIYHMAGLALG